MSLTWQEHKQAEQIWIADDADGQGGHWAPRWQKATERETADFLNEDNQRAADFWALVIWYAIVCLALLTGWTIWEVFVK